MIDRKHEFPKIDTDLFPFHHRAAASGYVSRVDGPTGFFAYKGHFGLGYVRYLPRRDVVGMCYVEYYIYRKSTANVETPR